MAPIFALIVTGAKTFKEFTIWAKSVEVWHPDAAAYVFTDDDTLPLFAELKTKLKIFTRSNLSKYTGLTRTDMEARDSSNYNSLWTEFMYEKAEVIRWAFTQLSAATDGVWFNDADIVHTAPLPHIPEDKTIGLSPHYIRLGDEVRFGRYNGGYFWILDPKLLDVWIAAAPKSRFYEQAALEEVAAVAATTLYEFPPNINFGWWRMFQGTESPNIIASRFSIHRGDRSIGLRYDNAPLQSIHSHMDDLTTSANGAFNKWLNSMSAKLNSHPPMRIFRKLFQGF
jgi:hypothetical protein